MGSGYMGNREGGWDGMIEIEIEIEVEMGR